MTMTPTRMEAVTPVRYRGLSALNFFMTAPAELSDALQEGYIPYSVIASLISLNHHYPDTEITFSNLSRVMDEFGFKPLDGSAQSINDTVELYKILDQLSDRYGNQTMTIEGLKEIGLQVEMTFYNANGKMKYCGVASLGHERMPHKADFNDDIQRKQGIISPAAAFEHTLVITETVVNNLDINYMLFTNRIIQPSK